MPSRESDKGPPRLLSAEHRCPCRRIHQVQHRPHMGMVWKGAGRSCFPAPAANASYDPHLGSAGQSEPSHPACCQSDIKLLVARVARTARRCKCRTPWSVCCSATHPRCSQDAKWLCSTKQPYRFRQSCTAFLGRVAVTTRSPASQTATSAMADRSGLRWASASCQACSGAKHSCSVLGLPSGTGAGTGVPAPQ